MGLKSGSIKHVRSVFIFGATLHLAGLPVYDSFPFMYLLSIPILCWSYSLFFKENGYRPTATPAFWGMVIVLALPIVGLIAGIQKIMITPKKEYCQDKGSWLLTSLTSLMLFIPIVVVFAAMIIPAFPDIPARLMPAILVCAGAMEVLLLAIMSFIKKRGREERC